MLFFLNFKRGPLISKWIDRLEAIIAIIFIATLFTLPGLSYGENSEPDLVTQALEAELNSKLTNSSKSENNLTPNIVAPNIDLKDVAPPPEALLETQSLNPEPPPANTDKKSLNNHPKKALKKAAATENINKPNSTTQSTVTPNRIKKDLKAVSNDTTNQSTTTPEPFIILGAEVPPGTSTRLGWTPGIAIAGLATPVPVLVVNGEKSGKTFCLMAAIHGDELNGIEVVRRVIYDLDPKKLSGRVIGVPIVNLQGFQRNSRYLADRRDLNRYFPGTSHGSLAARIAHSLFKEVITHCDALVDLHTGSLRRTNLPQLRADMGDPQAVKFTEFFDDIVVLHSPGKKGMLRWAAAQQNIPTVTFEIGESNRLQENQVDIGVKSINSLLDRLDMYERPFTWGEPEPVYYQSTWVRAQRGGILLSTTKLGSNVTKGEILGSVTDPITNEVSNIKTPFDGRIIGMAVNQVVMPGFAAYHLGIEASESEVSNAANLQLEEADLDDPEDQPE